MEPLDTLDLLVALSAPGRRAEVSRAVARSCGAEEFLLFVRDSELGALIPAPGLTQTLAGGPSWRALLARCAETSRCAERVELPKGTWRSAICVASDGIAGIFLGGDPRHESIAIVERVMPLLARMLAAEQDARFANAAAADAKGTADRARSLAHSLEAARAEHALLNAKLRDEHRRKDDFLAMLAHELRNPLTPLVTSIELIRRANGVASEKNLEIMARQVRQLSRLVEDLLDVSRVSRGRIELRRQRLRLADVVTDALDASRAFLDSRGHHVEVHLGDEDIHVDGDNVRLAQVFANLLHNAGKYTDPGGRIRVRAGREGREGFVCVEDNGLGIDPALLEGIFDLFMQAPMSLERAQGGLGIGLTLVRALVELHGGSIEAKSAGVGSGSTFTVRLPLPQDATRPAPASVGWLPAPNIGRSVRVLVVDDNEDAANSMAEMLRVMGHQAAVALSGVQAMHMAEDVDPDLVLLDIGLPEMDGLEIARRLRRSTRRRVRLVAVTGYGAEGDRKRSWEAGFDEHVVKPVMPETLYGIIDRAKLSSSPAPDTTHAG